MNYKSLINKFLLASILLLSAISLSAQDLDAGKALFRANCAACHAGDMKSKLTGPALGGSQERWADYGGEEALYSWVRNSQGMIQEGNNERANQLWAEWGPTVMTSFLQLSDDDLANVLAYIDYVYVNGKYPKADGDGDLTATSAAAPRDNIPLFIGLALLLALLAVVLARVASNLNYMIKVRETGETVPRPTLWETLTSRTVISFVVFALVVAGGYFTVNNAISLGRQQGYTPEQPIKFSHATHAGLQKLDCRYCHDGARRSKQSVIPASNTCMNCHKAIKYGSTYGTAELTKIYASAGYDPNTDKYIEGVENMSNEDLSKIYKKWIADQYVQQTGGMDDQGEEMIEEQWEGIVEALTDEALNDEQVYGPIPWVRIHNLPDHAYFNHAQHVSVGKVKCQTCHGEVQEMEVLGQYAPLSMGWCVNCHRQTQVDFANNEYYQAYENYHEEIQSGSRSEVTVEDIGGLECQKCHY